MFNPDNYEGVHHSFNIVARRWGAYTQPLASAEERFISMLERRFPGASWVTAQETDLRASADSAPSGRVAGPRENSGAEVGLYDFAFVGGSKFDAPSIEAWLTSLPPDATVLCGQARRCKDGHPMNAEALLIDLAEEQQRSVVELPPRNGLFGSEAKARELLTEEVLCNGLATVLTVTGAKVALAKRWCKRLGREPLQLS